MSRLARLVDLRGVDERLDAPAVLSVPRPSSELSSKHYRLLVEKLCEAHHEENRSIITAFTSISPGEGVTHVVETLAWELASVSSGQILLTTAAGLNHVARAGFRIVDPSSQERVHRIDDPGKKPLPPGRGEGLQELRLRFGFVLVDCPPLSLAPAVRGFFDMTDYVVLVVRAGRATYQEVTWAQTTLTSAAANPLGLVLNRTPDAISSGPDKRS